MQNKRIPHIMKAQKARQCPSNMIFFDNETRPKKTPKQWEDELHYLWFGCALSFRYEHGKRTRSSSLTYRKPAEFWQFIKSRLDKSRPLYVFAHNLPFDLTIVDFWQLAEPLGIKLGFAVLEDPPLIIEATWNDCKIVFLDTMNYGPFALASWGKDLGCDKLPMPKTRKLDASWLTYCQRDVEVTSKIVTGIIDFIHENDLGSFAYTTSKLALNTFKHRFMRHAIYVHDNTRVLELERASYHGGLVHCNFIGKIDEKKLYQLDVNSLYPYVMQNWLPTKLVATFKERRPTQLLSLMKEHCAVACCEISTDERVYPVYQHGRLLEAKGNYLATLCGPELERAIKTGDCYKVHDCAIYARDKIFKDYVTYFWGLRKKFKSEGNQTFNLFAKLLMNGLYGKFGQRAFEWVELNWRNLETLYSNKGKTIPTEYKVEGYKPTICWGQQKWFALGLDEPIKVRAFNGVTQIAMPIGEHYESCPIIAAYVTSMAREYLRDLIAIAGSSNTYYWDTDSLFVNDTGYSRLKAHKLVDNNVLGCLKLEQETDKAEFWCPKDYVFGDKVVRKGIRKDAQQQPDGSYRQLQFEGIKSVLRREPKPYIKIAWIDKKLSRKYNKGKVTPSGWVEYLTLAMHYDEVDL